MKTTLVAIYIGFTLRLVFCGSIVPATYANKSRVTQVHPAGMAITHHSKSVSFFKE